LLGVSFRGDPVEPQCECHDATKCLRQAQADRCWIEGDTVLNPNTSDVTKCLGDRFKVARPEAKQIGVERRSMGHVVPEREQQGALEQKMIGVRRLAQPVENSLQGEAREHLVEVRALGGEARRGEGWELPLVVIPLKNGIQWGVSCVSGRSSGPRSSSLCLDR
jgi:hypothetical protein